MAVAPHEPTTLKPRKRRPPDPVKVFETYVAECTNKGRWGAYKRTGERYGRTDEWARQVVQKHQALIAASASLLPSNLTYEPAPGEEEYAQIRESLAAQIAKQQADHALLCELVTADLPSPAASPAIDITPIVNGELPNSQAKESPKYQVFERRNDADRTAANTQIAVRLFLGLAVGMTACMLLVASKAPDLALLLFPEVMGLWWVVAEARRTALR